jgi:hypothetical protein
MVDGQESTIVCHILMAVNGYHTGHNVPKESHKLLCTNAFSVLNYQCAFFSFHSSFSGRSNLEANDFMLGHMTPFMCDAKFELLCKFKHDINIGQDVC